MDCEQCIARVAPYLDTRSPRCADSDALEIQNAPNRATCALDPPAAIQLRAGSQSHARETTVPAPRDCRRGTRLSYHPAPSAHHMKPSLAIKKSVDYQRVRVRMKVEIFAEGVDRNDDGRNAIVRRVANAACGTRTAEFFNGWARKRIRATETAKKSHKWSAVKSPLGAQTVLGDRHDPGFEV